MATADSMPSASAMIPDASAPANKAANGMLGPTVLGFLAFGLMSILFGLSQLPGPYGTGFNVQNAFGLNTVFTPTGTITGTMATWGGLVLILIGIIIFLKSGPPFWGSAFFGYGAFWATWSTIVGSADNHVLWGYGTAGFVLIWVLFTLTYLVSSFKHGWSTFVFFLVVLLAYILLVVEFWQYGAKGAAAGISGDELGVIAGLWILAGVIAWYAGTARLAEHTYGKKILPH
jgi:succinate-acetate transporter protein